MPKWEWKTQNYKYKLICEYQHNTALFVSITWHQNEPLGCVVYSHAQLMTYTKNVYKDVAYLAVILLSLLAYCRG